MRRAAIFLVVVFGACGDPAAEVAQDKCNALVDAWCNRAAFCGASRETCLSDASVALACARAVAVGPAYDACISDIARLACSTIAQTRSLPANCQGVIQVSR